MARSLNPLSTAMSSAFSCTLTRQLEETPHAVVFRGYRNADRKPIIAKMTRGEYPTAEELDRLRREYSVLSSLDLPGVVPALGIEAVGNGLALVFEDPGAVTVRDVICQGRPTLERFFELALAMTHALGTPHELNVVHGDVKPQNAFLDAAGAIKWYGFGSATRLSDPTPSAHDGTLLEGSLAYISPERTGRVNRRVDPRSDLYSLGVTLYELLTGKLPFIATDPLELVHSHIARAPRPPHELAEGIPSALSEIVLKLLAKTPEDRYQSCAGLEHDLTRCSESLRAGRSESFQLGAHDARHALHLPDALYGRDSERASVRAAFERARVGATEFVLIAGPSGIGKSALAHELEPLAAAQGSFVEGKFDELHRGVPLAAMAQACRSLVRLILSRPAASLHAWSEKLQDALGAHARLIADLVPELRAVIGEPPPVTSLGPIEAQRRFELVFQRFLQAFAGPQCPLVMCFDDLQWADPASLRMLQSLLTSPQGGHLLIIGTLRDNEVDAQHPLHPLLDAMSLAKTPVHTLTLAPLGAPEVSQLVASALASSSTRVEPLAALALRKTEGNPFFLGQFLTALANDDLLQYEARTSQWTWDLPRIEGAMVTPNVLELLVGRLQRLPERSQAAVRWAAYLGRHFDLETLALVSERTAAEVRQDLAEPLREGLVLQEDPARLDSFRFLHDRVEQAAREMIAAGDRAAVHLRVGRLLLARSEADPQGDELFAIVNHLNAGAAGVETWDEKRTLAQLDLRAGLKARDSGAHAMAATLLGVCLDLAGPEARALDYGIAFPALLAKAECEALIGHPDEAFRLLGVLEAMARSVGDRVEGRCLELKLLTNSNRMAEACERGVEALRLLGVDLPEGGALDGAIQAEFQSIQSALAGKDIDSLVDLPEMTDPTALAAQRTMILTIPAAFQSNPKLNSLLVLQAISLALRHGNPPTTSQIYSSFALQYAAQTQDYATAYRLGRVGITLAERSPHSAGAPGSEFVFAALVSHWRKHLSESLQHLGRGLRVSLETGSYVYASYCAALTVLHRFFAGHPLYEVEAELKACQEVLVRTEDRVNVNRVLAVSQLVASLSGASARASTFDGSGFDEAAHLEAIKGNGTLVSNHRVFKAIALYYAGDFPGSLAMAEQADAVAAFSRGFFISTEHVLYRALARVELLRDAPAGDRDRLLAALRQDEALLERWAAAAPDNHAHPHALIAAEIAVADGNADLALDHYDRAIAGAQAHGFLPHEAIARELTARFHLARGRERLARSHLMDAHHAYLRWGASAKAERLAAEFPELLMHASSPGLRAPATAPPAAGGLDLEAAVRMTQAISSERSIDKLVERLMRSLVENAGAQRGFLALPREDRLELAAAVTVDPDTVKLGLAQPIERCDELASSVVQYVAHSREAVVLDDACDDRRFAADPYISRSRPRSVLCVAMLHQGRLIGVLYLENNAAPRVFNPARLELLQFLAAQAAVAIENAGFYEQLERRVEERTAALAESQRKLVEASRQAGMADVATSVLHNVGNVLNSVNVASGLVVESIKRSKSSGVSKLAVLLNQAEVRGLLEPHPQAKQVPGYVKTLSEVLEQEQASVLKELDGLQRNIEHIKVIVAMQQTHGRGSKAAVEPVSLRELVDDAVALDALSFRNHPLEIVRELAELPALMLDRHKVLQIITNLLSNARHALRDQVSGAEPIAIRVQRAGKVLRLQVQDTGCGIAAENMGKIFNHGFTTRSDGHGFGLHASANAATEMGGSLTCASDGAGRGATFTLDLPWKAA
jgi:predicted ATPase/signal transduction histidine kinase